MSRDNVILRLTNKNLLNKFQELKHDLSNTSSKKYTNDDVLEFLLNSVSKLDTLSENNTQVDTQVDTLSKLDTLLDTLSLFVDKSTKSTDAIYTMSRSSLTLLKEIHNPNAYK